MDKEDDLPEDSIFRLKLWSLEHLPAILVGDTWDGCIKCSGTNFTTVASWEYLHKFRCSGCGQTYMEWN